ncbi:hypothetical protein HYFRA_00000590 [Hymenoscyphus fraxineus]|uniref:Eisosome protein 1 n=1 Tax=Hymenoscyphus fraxineus TaxID=746836 RepID=A0A9N9PSN4_9HELO|nr:hypothetical protein HYFRA_00000590 [Hymenoscyphus fraxineus]
MAQPGAMMATSTGPMAEPHTNQATGPTKLEDQAALAALYVNKYDNTKTGREHLDSNNKLSSASMPFVTLFHENYSSTDLDLGAATSLKYAKPEDLPSYPSPGLGLRKHKSAAGTAASLGWANQKSFEHWKPDPSTSASTAAMLAKDYKMAPQWQPEQSSHGAKAALLAHKNDGKVEVWRPEASAWGNSAAAQAFKKYGAGQSSPKIDYGYTELGRKGSLMAATGAMSTSRRRADSTPQPLQRLETYPDEANAAANALSAATHAHKPKNRSNLSTDGGSVPYTTMSREMYTSHPPVAPEVEERSKQDSLHASAVAMAKQMYDIQQKHIDAASNAHRAAVSAHDRQPSPSGMSDDLAPMKYSANLHEAAHKLAQERLAKLHNEHAKNRDYRDYYGSPQQSSRLSIRGRTRRRASSDGLFDEDRENSNKICAQMSLFSSNLDQVDSKKRQHDREALIAVAQRNVTNRLHGMDERVYADTGRVGPSLLSEWEVKAHAAAQANSASRMENYGKIDIGGGRFIDQSAVDAVAAKNIQPILDDINEKAEKERERQAEVKLDQERQKAKAEEKKAREKEEKEINRKLKQHDKEEEKARKFEEKKAKEEEKRVSKERRKSLKSDPGSSTVPVTTPQKTTDTNPESPATSETPAPTTLAERRKSSTAELADLNTSSPETTASSPENNATFRAPKSPPFSPREGGKVKNWLKNTFNRRSRKSSTSAGDHGFIGGAALTGASHSANKSNTSITGSARSESMRDVALASPVVGESSRMGGLDGSAGMKRGRKGGDSVVSSLSSPSKDDEYLEARDGFDDVLVSPRSFAGESVKGGSPAREARFREEI